MDLSFSQRYEYKPVKTVMQVEAIDDELRTSLWNVLDSFYWSKGNPGHLLEAESNKLILSLLRTIWSGYLKLPNDTIGNTWDKPYGQLRAYYFSCAWNEVYDFIEFIANNGLNKADEQFRRECNRVLKREVAGYRFVGDCIVQITAEEEIAEIEQALASKGRLQLVATHLQTALGRMSDRKSPDYRNSVKESISAVEALAKLVTKKDKATLPEALKAVTDKKVEVHIALKEAFTKLYGYTSDADGIRHSLMDEPTLDFEDAKFMLVSCSAFVNYLKVKSSKVGINLETA